MLNTTRRQWQRQAIALALAPWCLPIAQPQDVARHWKTSPFALGVASGSPRADGVVLWTRLLIDEADRRTGANSGAANGSVTDPVTVRWELFADDAMRQLVRQGQVVTDATRGHSVHVPLRDLPAGRDYWYRFTCGDATSAVGRTRTAAVPADSACARRPRPPTRPCSACAWPWPRASTLSRDSTLPTVTWPSNHWTSCSLSVTTSTRAPIRAFRFARPRAHDARGVPTTLRAVQA